MNIESILSPERTTCDIRATSKKKALQEISRFIHQNVSRFSSEEIFENLIDRERLGSTALGNGIAIPHCRFSQCTEEIGALFRLPDGVDFEAPDDLPVTLIFVLLVPAEAADDHVKTLAMLVERFDSEQYREALMSATNARELYDLAIKDPLPQVRSA